MLYGAAMIAGLQGDLTAETTRVPEARVIVEHVADPLAHGLFGIADGFKALMSGDFDRACECFEDAIYASYEPTVQVPAMTLLGWALEFRGDTAGAIDWQERALALSESCGESVYRSYALWSLGIVVASW